MARTKQTAKKTPSSNKDNKPSAAHVITTVSRGIQQQLATKRSRIHPKYKELPPVKLTTKRYHNKGFWFHFEFPILNDNLQEHWHWRRSASSSVRPTSWFRIVHFIVWFAKLECRWLTMIFDGKGWHWLHFRFLIKTFCLILTIV